MASRWSGLPGQGDDRVGKGGGVASRELTGGRRGRKDRETGRRKDRETGRRRDGETERRRDGETDTTARADKVQCSTARLPDHPTIRPTGTHLQQGPQEPPPKKRTAVQPFGCNGRPAHGPTEVGAFAAVLLLSCHRWLLTLREGKSRPQFPIPRPAGRPTWFVRASAAGLAGSRTDLPHCTPRRKIGAVGARDWLQLFGLSGHRYQRNL